VQRNAEGLKQCACLRINVGWERKAGPRRDDHAFPQTAVVRIQAAKVEVTAEIGVALLAQIAPAAWLRRVDGNPHPGSQALRHPVERVFSCFRHYT
jgi:hypothetical protein